MGGYSLLWCIVLFLGSAAPRAAGASDPVQLPRENLLSVLFDQGQPLQRRGDLERHMATVSIIMGLVALGVAVPTLVWCQRLRESVAHLQTGLSDGDTREKLAELTSECQSLHTRVEHLRQCWQADTGRLESALRQLENRTVGLEQGYSSLGTVAQDLEGLRDSRREVEPVLR